MPTCMVNRTESQHEKGQWIKHKDKCMNDDDMYHCPWIKHDDEVVQYASSPGVILQ